MDFWYVEIINYFKSPHKIHCDILNILELMGQNIPTGGHEFAKLSHLKFHDF